MKYTEEELIKMGMNRYPEYTKFKSAYSETKYDLINTNFYVDSDGDLRTPQDFQPVLYHAKKDKWAEIIEYPKGYKPIKEKLIYEIY